MRDRVAGKLQLHFILVLFFASAWASAQSPEVDKSHHESSVADASFDQSSRADADEQKSGSYVIGNDDQLTINVWKEPDVSRSLPVRSDGRISLPLVGEVQATGRTPLQLEKEIASKLKSYITDPEVTVMVQQINSSKYNILGQVSKPGSYPLTQSMTVLDAIAAAGGFRDFAKQKDIYILRQNSSGGKSRIPFNYKDVVKGKNSAQNINLEPRDTVVVP
jgi:polysaccharide biosynthesis/export protein